MADSDRPPRCRPDGSRDRARAVRARARGTRIGLSIRRDDASVRDRRLEQHHACDARFRCELALRSAEAPPRGPRDNLRERSAFHDRRSGDRDAHRRRRMQSLRSRGDRPRSRPGQARLRSRRRRRPRDAGDRRMGESRRRRAGDERADRGAHPALRLHAGGCGSRAERGDDRAGAATRALQSGAVRARSHARKSQPGQGRGYDLGLRKRPAGRSARGRASARGAALRFPDALGRYRANLVSRGLQAGQPCARTFIPKTTRCRDGSVSARDGEC